eukprot:scaffold845_cov199-Alexandrium_tamarense.AAC.9
MMQQEINGGSNSDANKLNHLLSSILHQSGHLHKNNHNQQHAQAAATNAPQHSSHSQQQQQPMASSNQSPLHQLANFAFLLSSAREEGSIEPVVGMNHDVDLANCFSRRHLTGATGNSTSDGNDNGNNGGGARGMRGRTMPPPCISASSLSMHNQNKPNSSSNDIDPNNLQNQAVQNMAIPFYTTPDTASITAKTLLKNVVLSMEELMEARMSSTVLQLMSRTNNNNNNGGDANSRMLYKLLSPSKNPLSVATVVTRFGIPEEGFGITSSLGNNGDELFTTTLEFKATIDVKIFGEISTVELAAPVTMSGRFDTDNVINKGENINEYTGDGLLTAVDIRFNCPHLLQNMISHARTLVKTAVTRAAALSIQIAEWNAKSSSAAATLASAAVASHPLARSHPLSSILSLQSLGSIASLASLGSKGTIASTTFESLFTSYSSLSGLKRRGGAGSLGLGGGGGGGSGSFGLGLGLKRPAHNFVNNGSGGGGRQQLGLGLGRGELSNVGGNGVHSANANATFDIGNTNLNLLGRVSVMAPKMNSLVRFKSPSPSSGSGTLPHMNVNMQNIGQYPRLQQAVQQLQQQQQQQQHQQQHQQHQQQHQQLKKQAQHQQVQQPSHASSSQCTQQMTNRQQQSEEAVSSNIHKGLFSWLENEPMFLSEDKIKEQNKLDEERERKEREAPMPLRFFTAAEGTGGDLESVGVALFGESKRGGSDGGGDDRKRRRQS